ncbi:MAG: hypothetical protein Kow0098_19310 [Ignavibacteriaceae bacterium]
MKLKLVLSTIASLLFSLQTPSQTNTFQDFYGDVSGDENGKSAVELSTGNLLLASLKNNKLLLYWLDERGEITDSKIYQQTEYLGYDIIILRSTGNILISIGTKTNGGLNIVHATGMDESGNIIWEEDLFEASGLRAWDAIIDENNCVIMTKTSGTSYIIKINDSGNTQWIKPVPIYDYSFDFKGSICKSFNGGYVFTYANYITELTPDGEIIKQINFTENITDLINSYANTYIIISKRGLIGGSITRLDENLEFIWTRDDFSRANEIIELSNHNLVSLNENLYRFYSEDGEFYRSIETFGEGLKLYPNSAGGYLTIGLYMNDYYNNYTWVLQADSTGNYHDLMVIKPDDGSIFSAGNTHMITWEAGYQTDLDISISTDNGMTWETLASNVPADSSGFSWYVPVLISDSAKIKITDSYEPAITDLNTGLMTLSSGKAQDYIAINEIKMWFGNDGMGSHDPIEDDAGFFWPGGENAVLPSIFADGLVWGGKYEEEIRVNGSTYRYGIVPGIVKEDGSGDDPFKGVYTIWDLIRDWEALPPGIERDIFEYNFNNWPGDLGAPFIDKDGDGNYTPGIDEPDYIGDEVMFHVSNDLDTIKTNFTYGTDPMGLEIQLTVFAFDREDELKNAVYKRYRIINEGNTAINNMYFAYWADNDMGYPADDYAGCDTLLNLGFQYNGDNDDEGFYGTTPPAIGHKLVQGPIVEGSAEDSAMFKGKWIRGYKNLPMTSFVIYLNGSTVYSDPELGVKEGSVQFYNNFQGYTINGTQFIDVSSGLPTKFCLSGDPVSGTGWYEGNGWPDGPPAGDRRYCLSTGPFDLAPGDTQEVAIAIIMGQGTDNINSITALKNTSVMAQNFYESNFTVTNVINQDDIFPGKFALHQNYPNPFNPSTLIKFEIPVSGKVTLKIYDILGREIATLVDEEKDAGKYSVEFNAAGLASGVYFYRIQAGNFTESKKMILLR